ncbi:Uu.00g108200.m01.CDS01 [Anthostomella pinea]|uniref:Uu.00g108200.m01.CDS01 n=1 Tax=Anthostomella pinea TaxID=933095 RepID=A0AAI8VEC8_9PEZI|nr:Uu.00g108200.m01.CDS01 [Anthostomella pinea]
MALLTAEAPDSAYTKPQPRAPRSPAHAAQIRVQNRRREYLERHPSYFKSMEHELADPLLYDALIRRFQSAEEREREGRAKGYGRVLEVDLLRGEAKLTHLAALSWSSTQSGNGISASAVDQDAYIREYAGAESLAFPTSDSRPTFASGGDLGPGNGFRRNGTGREGNHSNGSSGNGTPNPASAAAAGVGTGTATATPRTDSPAPGPSTQQEGRERWADFLRRRFVLGRDEDFDYRHVDEDDDYDVLERREREDEWFDYEEPAWAGGEEEGEEERRRLRGETGVQDF